MNKSSLRIVAAWLQGQADAGVDLNGGIELPLFLKPQLAGLLQAAVLADENRPMGQDAFERGGVWHRAVNRVMAALSDECKDMTWHYEYPQGLGLGDGAFHAFMQAIRAFRIELPSDEEISVADAEREATSAEQAAYSIQPLGEWDGSEAYDYT